MRRSSRSAAAATTEDADLVGVVSLCELGSTVTGGGGADDGSAGYGVGHLIDLAAMAPSRSVGDGGGPLSPVQRSTQAMMEETFDFRSSICSLPASLFLSLLADCPSRALDNAALKISAEDYEYEIFRSPEEYSEAKLEPTRYDLPAKYTPKKAEVTVPVGPPLPDAGSQGAMRSFLVSARPPAPATKISLGSKRAKPSRPADPSAETSVPTGLPLATTHPTGLSSDQYTTRAAKRGKEKEVIEIEEVTTAKRPRRDGSGSTTPVIDVLMKYGDEPLRGFASEDLCCGPSSEEDKRMVDRLSRGTHRSRPHPDPVLLAQHICRGREIGEAVLAAVSRTLIGEDLVYDFGTWAFNKGRRAMQNDVQAALVVSIDDGDLPKVLAVLPEEVPDPGPTPFSTVPEGQVLLVPLADASAGPTAEAVAAPNAGPTAEGTTEPGVEPSAERQ
nr:leucine zipper putative tumor suppressor 2-like [Ipomoea batatas]